MGKKKTTVDCFDDYMGRKYVAINTGNVELLDVIEEHLWERVEGLTKVHDTDKIAEAIDVLKDIKKAREKMIEVEREEQ